MKSSLPEICSALIIAHDRAMALCNAADAARDNLEAIARKLLADHGQITDEAGNIVRHGVNAIVCGDRLIKLGGFPFVTVERANVVVIGSQLRLEHVGGAR